MMWTPQDFSYRKFRRKYEQDGVGTALHASAELATRKLLAPPVLHYLIDRGSVTTLDRDDLFSLADQVYSSQTESYVRSPTELGDSEFVADLAGGYLLPNSGLGTDSAGRPIRETVEPPRTKNITLIEAIVWNAFYDSPQIAGAVLRRNTSGLDSYAKSLDIACSLCPRFINYYHWMKETVPKLRYVREYEAFSGLEVTYLVPSDAPSWLDETLDLLNVPENQVERATAPVYQVDRLLVPSFPGQKPQNYQWVRDQILSTASPDREAIGAGNNIYISRANAIERRVVNELEIVETLSEYGFESYRLEDHSLAENALLFNEADLIVGPHGAGLTDIIFCTDTKVVELFGSKVRLVYKQLAEMLELEYQLLKCEPQSTDIVVDVDELEEIIT